MKSTSLRLAIGLFVALSRKELFVIVGSFRPPRLFGSVFEKLAREKNLFRLVLRGMGLLRCLMCLLDDVAVKMSQVAIYLRSCCYFRVSDVK